MRRCYYHVTDKKKIPLIMRRGLLPRTDPHLQETMPEISPRVVNLTIRKSVNMWESTLLMAHLIKDPVVLEVCPRQPPERIGPEWYVARTRIPPSELKVWREGWKP